VGATNGVVGTVALDTETAVLAASGGEASSLAVLVDGVANPVDAGIVSNGGVLRIDHDDFEVLVSGVLVDPVGVQDTQVGADSASALLGNTSQVSDELKLVDTLVLGLTIDDTLVVGSLAATTADGTAVDHIALK
jgi:hypothetical protein